MTSNKNVEFQYPNFVITSSEEIKKKKKKELKRKGEERNPGPNQ